MVVPSAKDSIPSPGLTNVGGPTMTPNNFMATAGEADTVRNLKSPDMITEGSQFSLYEKRLFSTSVRPHT